LLFPSINFWRSIQYGALYFSDGTFVVFENCTFSDNTAVADDSYSAGACIDDGTVFMNGNLFVRNRAYKGAALYLVDSHVEALCNKFEGNLVISDDYTPSGGAIYIEDSSLDAEFNHFINNTATLGYGGAIGGVNSQLYSLSNTFSSNTADYYGGAIDLEDSSLDAKFNHFLNNTATLGYGGAVSGYTSQLYSTSNTFSFNTAEYGGAVAATGSGIVTNADSFTSNAATVSLSRASI
jgi:hypothetical protein